MQASGSACNQTHQKKYLRKFVRSRSCCWILRKQAWCMAPMRSDCFISDCNRLSSMCLHALFSWAGGICRGIEGPMPRRLQYFYAHHQGNGQWEGEWCDDVIIRYPGFKKVNWMACWNTRLVLSARKRYTLHVMKMQPNKLHWLWWQPRQVWT